jgi:hypothetical protein
MISPIPYVSHSIADHLYESVPANLDRYLTGSFADLATDSSWSLRLRAQYNPSMLNGLDAAEGESSEVANSLLVWKAFPGMTPALARENRIWVRASHVECLGFCRSRWLTSAKSLSEEKLITVIRSHFFAGTLTSCRDDHAVSRLWWNALIAALADPGDLEGALALVLRRADTRSNLIERPWMFNRPVVANGVLGVLREDKWVIEKEAHFREFMKSLNIIGSGIAFEVLDQAAVKAMMSRCVAHARAARLIAQRAEPAVDP